MLGAASNLGILPQRIFPKGQAGATRREAVSPDVCVAAGDAERRRSQYALQRERCDEKWGNEGTHVRDVRIAASCFSEASSASLR